MQKLIVIEGLDGSGKSTQAELLEKSLKENGVNYRKIKLPDYESPSSTLVKMYLSGDFGKEAAAVNAYAAGAFYAVDRYASFNLDWKKDYDSRYSDYRGQIRYVEFYLSNGKSAARRMGLLS